MKSLKVADKQIGFGQSCFIIGEAGVNHNGNVDMGLKLVDVAADAGVDAIKFQTFKAENLVTRFAPKAAYQYTNTGKRETQFEMIRELELSKQQHKKLAARAAKRGIVFLSTPFDSQSVDFLADIGLPAFKLPSGEITNTPLIEHAARKGKPIILSTGMSTLGDVETAVRVIHAAGNHQLALLHCVSNYPADPSDVNLRVMRTLSQAFDLPVGYSDHTLGNEVSFAAVAMGACIVEKHFTLDRGLPGPDHAASATPEELSALVSGIRKIEAAAGSGRKTCTANEADISDVARRSIVAARDLRAGTILTADMLAMLRPGTGLPPTMLPLVVGRKLRKAVHGGELIEISMLC